MEDEPLEVVATCPIALTPCTACGHMPCLHCESSCDEIVELPLDEAAAAARRASIEVAPSGAFPMVAARTVACAQCDEQRPLSAMVARSQHEDLHGWTTKIGYFCSEACIEAWVNYRDCELCHCEEKGCVYADGGVQNAEACRWYRETVRALGMDKTGGSSGLDDEGHILVCAPKKARTA